MDYNDKDRRDNLEERNIDGDLNNEDVNEETYENEPFEESNYNKEPSTEEETYQDRKSYASIPEDIYLEREEPPRKKKGFRGSFLSYIAIALVASIVGGFSSNYLAPLLFNNGGASNNAPPTEDAITINTNDDINTVTAVVKKSMPSVVGITTLETRDNLFMEKEDILGVGSGVIVNDEGYILTNSHVIANGNAKDITVLLYNGDQEKAKLLWFDQTLDLAVVKVEKKGLKAMELGDSDKLEVGELAIAIGNPLGLEYQRSVTSGIISGLNRSVSLERNIVMDDLIQTDAAINQGNSGGPLLNSKGQVIGINTAKIRGGEGLGFSIPINSTKSIIEEVIDKGTFETVQLGIMGRDIMEYQSMLGIDLGLDKGVIVLQIVEDSPAENYGLVKFDIILKIDDKDVESMQNLKKTLYDYTKGDKVTLSILRNDKEEKIDIQF